MADALVSVVLEQLGSMIAQKVEKEAVLKLGLHCQGCTEKIVKIVRKAEGVQEIVIDRLVTVKGTMDVKALAETLKERLKRPVDIVTPKEEKGRCDSSLSGLLGVAISGLLGVTISGLLGVATSLI
ncbi:hypothetical protein DKX38_027562 [Salix brachista]|uniref:HMA domain-containing protein n=1 Tax=Salix brachista TaxID=2182728 RepID=A0A5N5J5H7_9ROSI|nr:hypothetical protein DKX38_027562 [Salix brachista]